MMVYGRILVVSQDQEQYLAVANDNHHAGFTLAGGTSCTFCLCHIACSHDK